MQNVMPTAAPDLMAVQHTMIETSAGRTDLVLARFWRRTAAAAVDTVLLTVEALLVSFVVLVVTSVIMGIASAGPAGPAAEPPWLPMAIATVLLQVIFSWLYSALLHSSAWQATIGMRLTGLAVTDLHGRRLSFARATARYAAKRLVVWTLYLGFFMIAATNRRQALHDLLAGTIVAGRRPVAAEAGATEVFDRGQVWHALDHAFLVSRDRLPGDLHARVAAIRQKIWELLPHAARIPMGSRDRFVLRRTATDYLPTSIDAYLALQTGYATTHVLPGGRTALQLLEDQLKLLEWKVDEIGMALRQLDSQRLLAHGRFLEETFDRRSENLGLPTNQPALSPDTGR